MNFLSMLGVDGSRVRAILQPIVDVLNVVWIPVVSLLGTFGAIYSIILAVFQYTLIFPHPHKGCAH